MYKKIVFLLIFCVVNLKSMFCPRLFLNQKVRQKCFKFKTTKRFLIHKNNVTNKMLEQEEAYFCGYTPLHIVFISDHYENVEQRKKMARLLLNRGANPNAQDIFGNTSLHWAMRFNDPDLIMLLIEHG